MIEQQRYPIETGNKYNFPGVPFGAFDLPHDIADLCLFSMQELHEQNILGKGDSDANALSKNALLGKAVEVIHFESSCEEACIAGVDVSSMKIGETQQGAVLAVRGAIVWNINRAYHYLRLGPFVFHITDGNKRQILRLLSPYQNNLPVEFTQSDFFPLQSCISGIFERWIQSNLCSTYSGSLILFDGSLTARRHDTSESLITHFLEVARSRANIVLAFSKLSRMTFNGMGFDEIVEKENAPCLARLDGLLEDANAFVLLGNVYAAKFSDDAVCFRLDIDKELSSSCILDAAQKLLGNDIFHHGFGYPETLRLAHIYSTFTATEVIGMQHYLEQERGLKIEIKPNIRRLLFGPFGKGLEG